MAPMPHPRIGDSSGGCAFRCTTYRNSDFVQPSGKYGLPLYHPRFLEWVGPPESARLLDLGPVPGHGSLSRAQSVDVALPIAPGRVSHGLNPKYTGPVYTMSSGDGEKKLLELTWGRPDFPSAAAAPLTRVPRVSTHVEAMSGTLP